MGKTKGKVVVDTDKCKGCRLCVETCPHSVLDLAEKVNAKGYNFSYMKNPESCTGCTNCAVVCPDGVIEVFRVKPED